jgi:hypothetical protein
MAPPRGNYNAPPSSKKKPGPKGRAAPNEMELSQAISDRLETGLNEAALRAIADLLRAGVHPDVVVAVVTSLHQQASSH